MHSFGYDLASEEFQRAQASEVAETGRVFPMALWGAAMSTMMILWQYSDCTQGESFLKQLPAHLPPWLTEFELDIVNTGFELYPHGFENCTAEDTQFKRENRFAIAMARVAKKHPEKVDAQAFHLVAKLATLRHPRCKEDPEKCAQEMGKVRESLVQLYKANPTHTGIMHYIVHAFDDPLLFLEGNRKFVKDMEIPSVGQSSHPAFAAIQAGRDYMKMGKSLCHALHMPSHLFIKFGDWIASSASNLQSIEVLTGFHI